MYWTDPPTFSLTIPAGEARALVAWATRMPRRTGKCHTILSAGVLIPASAVSLETRLSLALGGTVEFVKR
jgi:hypothetical protein